MCIMHVMHIHILSTCMDGCTPMLRVTEHCCMCFCLVLQASRALACRAC
jgi:hypothetical protein